MKHIMVFLVLVFFSVLNYSNAGEDFNVRKHLSTVSRYGIVKDISDDSFVPSDIPEGCVPIHLNLVERHGTRSPTKKRIRELDNLATSLKSLIRDAESKNLLLDRVPSWLRGWESPWKGRLKGGELISKGEKELYDMGISIRENFPTLFNEECHPDIHPIKATQDFRKIHEPAVNKLKEPILDEIKSTLVERYGLNFTRQDVSSLWFLCKQFAGVFRLHCWSGDDLELYILKGYGKALNYRMGMPLLEDVFQSMEQAIQTKEEKQAPGSYEKSRLRFAHAETVVPFSCLLGLFLEGSGKSTSNYFVRVLQNEHPIPMPGCGGLDFCPFEVFKDKIVAPHRKHDYDTVCSVKAESTANKFSQMFQWLFSPVKGDKSQKDEF